MLPSKLYTKMDSSVDRAEYLDDLCMTAVLGVADDMVDMLNVPGFEINEKNAYGGTTLHTLAGYHQFGGVLVCLDAGADVNAKDMQGNTALHRAIRNMPIYCDTGNTFDRSPEYAKAVVEILIYYEADINIMNERRETAVDIAKKVNAIGVLDILLSTKHRNLRQIFESLADDDIIASIYDTRNETSNIVRKIVEKGEMERDDDDYTARVPDERQIEIMARMLHKTRVTICNEQYVANYETLLSKFNNLSGDMFKHSRFVAVEVGHIEDDDHEAVMDQYAIQNFRGSGMFLAGWRFRLWIWDVTIGGRKFLVFGPHGFIGKCEDSPHCPDHQVVVETMVRSNI
jgi:hypothetical protein